MQAIKSGIKESHIDSSKRLLPQNSCYLHIIQPFTIHIIQLRIKWYNSRRMT